MDRRVLQGFLLCITAAMIGVTVWASLKESIAVALPGLAHQPWGAATFFDFYFNITLLSIWTFYREKSASIAALWVASFILLGSIATSFYAFLKIAEISKDSPLWHALLNARDRRSLP